MNGASKEEEIPPQFRCPLSLEIMSDPVLASDEQTYEREWIEEIIAQGKPSPFTDSPLTKELRTNYAIKSLIDDYLTAHPDSRKEQYLTNSCKKMLIAAIKEQNIEKLKYLLNSDDRLDKAPLENNRHLLHLICETRAVSLQFLCDVVVFLKGKPQLWAELLVSPKPFQWSTQALNEKIIFATKEGKVAEVDILLELGADIHCRSAQTNRTLLNMAARNGHTLLVKVLLKKGLTYDFDDAGEARPLLHGIAESGDIACMHFLLLNARAPKEVINMVNANGLTPLHKAVAARELDMVKLLIEAGADVHAEDLAGNTPLHWAVKATTNEANVADTQSRNSKVFIVQTHQGMINHLLEAEIMTLLLKAGADYKAADHQDETPLSACKTKAFQHFLSETYQQYKIEKWRVLGERISALEKITQVFSEENKDRWKHFDATQNVGLKEQQLKEKEEADISVKTSETADLFVVDNKLKQRF